MGAPRNWTRLFVLAAAGVVAASIALSFLPNRGETLCQDATWNARSSWLKAQAQIAGVHRRLVESANPATLDDWTLIEDSAEVSGIDADHWSLWAAARDRAGDAERAASMSPVRARDSAHTALEACWSARDKMDRIPVRESRNGKRAISPSRLYRPGATAIKACEEALSRSELAWEACQYQLTDIATAESVFLRGDYDLFGDGCF